FASNGAEALELYDQNPAQLLIIDWVMPEMDGLEVARSIRKQLDGDLPVIVMMTTKTGPEDLDRALEAGVDDYIGKPLRIDTLIHRIKIAARHFRARQALKETHNRY